MSTYVPTTNVVLTNNVIAAMLLRDEPTFNSFKQKSKGLPGLIILDNRSNSNLISLEHVNKDKVSEISISLLDNGNFLDELIGEVRGVKATVGEIDRVKKEVASLTRDLITDTTIEGLNFKEQFKIMNGLLSLKRSDAGANSFYISYGLGDDFKDWCSPQSIGYPTYLSFDYDGTGTRVVSLKFQPEAGFLVLSPTFGREVDKLNIESLTARGISSFNIYDFSKSSTPDAPDKISLHRSLVDIYKQFIKQGTGTERVVVLLPDLDKFLWEYEFFKEQDARLAISEVPSLSLSPTTSLGPRVFLKTDEGVFNVGSIAPPIGPDPLKKLTMDGVAEGLGMEFVVTVTSEDSNGKKNSNRLLVDPGILGILQDKASVGTIFQEDYRLIIQREIEDNQFLKTLKDLVQKLYSSFRESLEGGIVVGQNYMESPTVLLDLNIIKVLEDEGVLNDENGNLLGVHGDPVVLWGDKSLINTFIYGASNSVPKKEASNFINPYDVVSEKVIQKLKIVTNIENTLTKETSFGTTYRKLEGSDYLSPYFEMGTPNSNVTGLRLDWDGRLLPIVSKAPQIRQVPFVISQDVPEKALEELNELQRIVSRFYLLPGFAFGRPKVGETARPLFEEGLAIQNLVNTPSAPNEFREWVESRIFFPAGTGETTQSVLVSEITNIFSFEGFSKESYTPLSERVYDRVYDLDEVDALWVRVLNFFVEDPTRLSRKLKKDLTATEILYKEVDILDKLQQAVLTLDIITLPTFRLGSTLSTISKRCRFNANIPQLYNKTEQSREEYLSGIYTIMGFKHVISKDNAYSEFVIKNSSFLGDEN